MDLKRKIIIGIVVIAIVSTICILLNIKNGNIGTNGDNEIIDNRPLNNTVDLVEVFKELDKLDGIEEIQNSGDLGNEINQEDIEKEIVDEEQIDFGKYNVLEKKAIVKTTDTEVNEIWMVKLGDIKQQEDVCRIFGNRIHKLREAFKEDAVQTQVINDAVIKQEDGIVIMIISPNKMEIEKTIGNLMK